MSKFSSLKNINLVKQGEVEIKGYVFPIKTTNLNEQLSDVKFDASKFKKKSRIMTAEEKEQLSQIDTSLKNSKLSVMVIEYDLTDPTYIKHAEETLKIKENLLYIKYIDMDMKIEEEDNKSLWEIWGIPKGDWLGVYNFLISVGFDLLDMNLLKNKIAEILSPKMDFSIDEKKEEVEEEKVEKKSKKAKKEDKEEIIPIIE
jgi:hypothetical protein